MKINFWTHLLSFLALSCLSVVAELSVRVTNIEQEKGLIGVLVFDRKSGFPEDRQKAKAAKVVKAQTAMSGEVTIPFPDLSAGTYAIVVIHDLDSNYKLKKNLIGIPLEPIGVTNWSRKGKPKFKSSVITVKEKGVVSIKVERY